MQFGLSWIRYFNARRSPFSVLPTRRLESFSRTTGTVDAAGRTHHEGSTVLFGAIDVFRSDVVGTSTSTVPTVKMKNGDFSDTGRVVYDPSTQRTEGGQTVRDPFPNNIIPANRNGSCCQVVAVVLSRSEPA